jgi:hypothetical protein
VTKKLSARPAKADQQRPAAPQAVGQRAQQMGEPKKLAHAEGQSHHAAAEGLIRRRQW